LVIGLESNGIHSNGYSLVRKALSGNELKRIANELLKPTRIYVKPVLSLLPDNNIRGIAHITGGAFYDKISRILPDNVDVMINKHAWVIPRIFRLIQNKGNIDDREMYHTLNMGIGMVLIVEPASAKKIIAKLAGSGLKSWVIGEVKKGKKTVQILGGGK
jgi:phosphoribosylformylglycinamidine cyclo-ligase